MKQILLLFIFVFLTISCQAQKKDLDLQWKTYEFPEAGMKASFPCEPVKSFKSFQDKPRPIHTYNFDCEVSGIKFLISSKNHLDDFDENTFERNFEANESNLKFMFGAVESFDKKENFLTNGFISKYYEIKPKVGGKVKSLMVVNESRSYEALFGVTPDNEKKLKNLKIDYDEIGKKFIDSFQILDK